MLNNIWYKKKLEYYEYLLFLLLLPISWLFCLIVKIRRLAYKIGIFKTTKFDIPIIIVGNITVGGSGKTPLVIHLAKLLKKHGFRPAIISRGYGGKSKNYPLQVYKNSNPNITGEEPILITKHVNCPLVISPKRIEAVNFLLNIYDCNVIISDDGLQHYALSRFIEINVFDKNLKYGNQHCLPAGPLREPLKRLQSVDFIIQKNYKIGKLHNLTDKNLTKNLTDFANKTVHAVAGIGNPEQFFQCLESLKLKLIEHKFPDHYFYNQKDLQFNDKYPVIMTEKDAIKCYNFSKNDYWYLAIEAQVEKNFDQNLINSLTIKGKNKING
jgi:tetraacyldisaccharide 4'-kinase